MRLTDLLHPHLDGVTTVVDATTGALRLEPYLHLPDGIALRGGGDRPLGTGDLVLLCYGPDPDLHGTEADCLAVLERMSPGARGLLLFGHPGPEPPYHRLLDGLVTHRCQVLRAAPLDYTHLHAGAVFTRTDELLPPHDWFGRPVPSDGFATALRTADEYVLADLVSRSLRARVLDLERRAEETAAVHDPAGQDRLTDRPATAVAEKDQLASALRAARDRVNLLETRVAMLEGSTSLRVGRVLVAAAKAPRQSVPGLPRELYGLWRGRRSGRPGGSGMRGTASTAGQTAGQTARLTAAPSAVPVVCDDRLHLAYRALSATPRDRLVVVGVLTDETAADVAQDAVVNRALPHDAALLVRRTDPDAVVVQLSACTGHGPWSLTGTGLAPDLDRALAELLTEARASGRAAVLWRDGPAAAVPGLARFAWDAVLDTDTGVRLARLDPAERDRDWMREVFLRDSTRLRVAALARLVGAPDPLDARRIAVLADPRDATSRARLVAQVLGQRLRPAEVIVPDPAGLDELDAAGVPVRTGAPAAAWVADWTDPAEDRPDTLLLDLMCAQEYSGADALGRTQADDDYTFVPALRPQLIRLALHQAGAPPETWSGQGHRLFAVRAKEPS